MSHLDLLRRKAEWAERKCDEAAASSEPWALANLRLYQNYLSRFLTDYYVACRQEGASPP